jgi:hypothetical protein
VRPLNMPCGSHGAWLLAAEMHKPKVDGIAEPLPIEDVIRLDATGLSPHAIAERLGVSVLDIEPALRTVARLKAWESVRQR